MERNGRAAEQQFSGGGPLVVVRNTFLDLDDRPPEWKVCRRVRTAPPAAGCGDRTAYVSPCHALAEEDSEEEEQEEEREEQEQELEDALELPRSPPVHQGCSRQMTRDWFESSEVWSWSGALPPPPADAYSGLLLNRGTQPSFGCGVPSLAAVEGVLPHGGGPPMMYAQPPADPASSSLLLTRGASGPPSFGGGVPGLAAAEGVLPHGGGPPMMYAQAPQMQMVLMPVTMARGEVGCQATRFGSVQETHRQLTLQQPSPLRNVQWPDALSTVQPSRLPRQRSEPASGDAPAPAPTPQGAGGPSPQPQTLTRSFSIGSACFRVHWTVDARKLRGNDKQAVSPPFPLAFGSRFPNVNFKMMIYPKVVNDSKGGASFKKAKGRGYVQLKCERELPEDVAGVSFRLSVGGGGRHEEPRGPVAHNFHASAVCGLPRDLEEWDFQGAVDQESMTFVVCLEIVPKAVGG